MSSDNGQPSARDRAIAALAARQHGNATRGQLLALGLNDQAISLRVAGGRLHRVHRGVYAVGRPPTLDLERAAAAVLACGERAALSHDAALALWGLRDRWPKALDVTVAAGHPRADGFVVHRSRALRRRDVVVQLGIRTTTLARALLDCAPSRTPRQLTRLVNDALLTPHLSRAGLADIAARFPTHPGAARLKPFLAVSDGPTRSEMEDRFLALCERYGLPRPQIGARVAGHEVDALFADQKLIVELDGWRFHRERSSFESDRVRDADTLVAGYRTVRYTWWRLTRQHGAVATQLLKLLDLAV